MPRRTTRRAGPSSSWDGSPTRCSRSPRSPPRSSEEDAIEASRSRSRSLLFFVAIGAFVYAFAVAVARSTRGDNVAVANLFFLQGSAPKRVRRDFLVLFLVCLAIAAAPRRGSRSACSCRCSPSASPACGRRVTACSRPVLPQRLDGACDCISAMADEAHEQIHVEADPLDCFDLATDFESYPSGRRT